MSPERKLRRNGLPLSCEPCRNSKVRCDHQGPQCSRCIARKLICVYNPTPTTRRYSPDPPYPRRVEMAANAPESSGVSPALQQPANPPPAVIPASDMTSPASSTQTHTNSHGTRRAALFHKQGTSYGPTRFSAVFSENQNSFASAIQDVVDPSGGPPISSPNQAVNTVAEPLKELAIDTLLSFPTLRTCEILLQDIDFIHDPWNSPTMISQCLSQVWTQYGEHLGPNRSRESAWAMARDLHERKNTAPLSEMDYDWINWFSGTALRWEMVGIIFSWAGLAFKHKQEWDPIFSLPEQQGRNRQTAPDKMRESSISCLKFCPAEISDITVCLMKNSVKLQSVIFSDECDQLRAGFGTVGSVFVTAGLHRLPKIEKVTPLNQYRSSLSASMYSADKRDSLFHGRPPMLNRPYCNCPPPLDLSEEDIYSGSERLAIAVSKLTPEGWNTDGKIYTTTWVRADALLSPIREDILLLSLSYDRQFTISQVHALIDRLNDAVKSYPPQIQYRYNARRAEDTSSGLHGSSAGDSFHAARIRLDVLQCQFLLQRLLVSQGCDGQKLFDTADEIMAVILSIWSNRDRMQNYCYAFDWIIVCFGIPAAGILCVELLVANAAASSFAATSQQPRTRVSLSRSKVVQSLVMFVAFLDWIRPTDNNAQLCWRFRDVLRKIIDTAFDYPHPSNSAIGQGATQESVPTAPPAMFNGENLPPHTTISNSMDFLQGINPSWMPMDDLDWLATVDWTQGDWLDSYR